MKRAISFLLILCLFLLPSGCKKSEDKDEQKDTPPPVESMPPNAEAVKPVAKERINALINNDALYDELDGRIYTEDDIKPFYIPFKVRKMFRQMYTLDNIAELFEIKFLREHDTGYYTYLNMENSRFFIFFDPEGIINAMFNYSLKPLHKKDFDSLKIGKSTVEDVMAIDKSTFIYDAVAEMINKEKTPRKKPTSEHLVSEGYMIEVEYEWKDDSLIVSNVYINPEFYSIYDRDPYFDGIYTVYP